jgi:hypothetical protein
VFNADESRSPTAMSIGALIDGNSSLENPLH